MNNNKKSRIIKSTLVILFGLLLSPWILDAQTVCINEVMSSNGSIISDEDGDFPDWVELYNNSSSSINLEGYGISDDSLNLKKWVFSNIDLLPGKHFLLFASGKDRSGSNNHWETVIRKGDDWKYQIGNSSIPSNWIDLSYNDLSWSEGPSGFGFDDGDDATLLPEGTISVFIRRVFTIDDVNTISQIFLHVDYDDAFVAYINGQEVARSNIGTSGTPVSYDNTADGDHGATIDDGGDPEKFDIGFTKPYLQNGENVLCIQGHNKSSTSSDMSLIPYLSFEFTAMPQNAQGPDPDLGLKASMFHTNFKINNGGERLYLTSPGGQIIDSVWINDIPEDISYGRKPDGDSEWLLFDIPTPALANNNEGYVTISSKPDFSHTRGFYNEAFDLTFSSEEENTKIMYTLDGSEPGRNSGTLYQEPINISTTTTVRAMAFKENGIGSDVRTHTYIFTTHVVNQDNSGLPTKEHDDDHIYWTEEFDLSDVAQYEDQIHDAFQDIPSMSITASYSSLFGINGILRGQNLLEGSGGKAGDPNEPDWEELVGCSVEMIYPENNKYSQYKNWQENSGIKIQGGGGRWNNGYYDHKQSFTLEFKKEFGAGLLKNDIFSAALFNSSSSPGEFDKIILRAGHNKSWGADWDRENTVYTRDQYGRDLQILMSGWGSRGTFVHLYINGKYWGLYNPCERMDDNALAIYFGGDNENYYFGKGKGGDQAGSDDRFDHLNNTTWTNSQLSEIEEYLAVDEYIDLSLLYCYANPGDGPQYYYGNSNEPAGPVYFTAWDIEDSFEGGSRRTGPPISVDGDFDAFHNCKYNIDFKMRFADRTYKHCFNGGILSDDKAIAVWDSLNQSIEKAILCEIARWGDERGNLYDYQHWLGEWKDVKDDLVNRASKMITQLKNDNLYPDTEPPVLKVGENIITKNLLFTDSIIQLTIESTVSGATMYYTMDGTDPRKWDLTGNISSTAIAISEQSKNITITDVIVLKLRTKNGNEWSPLREIKIVPDVNSGLIISEINCNSAPDFNTEDWVEIYNNSDEVISLKNWKLTDSDSTNVFYFPDELVIAKDKCLVICHDTTKFKKIFTGVDNYIGNLEFKFNNSGDEVKLYQSNKLIDSIKYDDELWPLVTLGNGATLQLIHPSLDNSMAENWIASNNYGTPGYIDSANPIDSAVSPVDTTVTPVDSTVTPVDSTVAPVDSTETPSDSIGTDVHLFTSDFILNQNYPNPFNQSTRIYYSINKPEKVNISVFDFTGKKVAELVNTYQDAGNYITLFEPKDLNSGIYFYRLKVGQSYKIRKMVYLK